MARLSLNILKLPVGDLDRALDFYTRGLGFRLLVRIEEFGWAQLERDGIMVALYRPGEGGGDRPPGGSTDFQFGCDNLVEFWRELGQRGLSPLPTIVSGPETAAFIDLADPDGNLLRVIQSEEDLN